MSIYLSLAAFTPARLSSLGETCLRVPGEQRSPGSQFYLASLLLMGSYRFRSTMPGIWPGN
jgi:hypothetical protein